MADHSAEEKQGDRPKAKQIGALWALYPFFRCYPVMTFSAIFGLCFTAGLSLIAPIAIRHVIDGFSMGDTERLTRYFFIALGLSVVFALGTGLRYYVVTRLGERVVADLRMAIFNRMMDMSPAFFDRLLTGEILSRITTDTTLILAVIGSSISMFLRNMIMMVGGLILVLVTTPVFTLYIVLGAPIVALPIVALRSKMRLLSKENQDWIATSSGRASESLLSIQTIQSFTHESRSKAGFSEVTEHSFSSALSRITIRTLITVLFIFFIMLALLALTVVGTNYVQSGVMTLGEFVQFLIYAALVASAGTVISEIWAELQRAAGATERLVELIYAQDSLLDPAEAQTPQMGAVVFDGVSQAFNSRPDSLVLDNVSFTLNQGETVALVGPSGAGKSTIMQLLQRFYDPNQGQISIGGIALCDMQRTEFRKLFATVPQDPVIFAASIYENILFANPTANDAQVRAAAKAAAADEFIFTLPDGYDTYAGERGLLLSGGQKQRIAIARAILRDAPIFLLDEATSALDAESEVAVQTAFENMANSRTTLVIAHRLATVRKADRILVMEHGKIIASGTHIELMQQGGLYARLARMQLME